MRLSSANLEVLRTRPQQTTLYLSIFQPQTIFQATINDASIARGARTITYNNSSGNYTDIEANYTLLIGTTAGARDIGKIRIRSATSTQITVSENSNINWQNGQKLTVLKYVELWPIFTRIVLNPANESDSIFYKDYDVLYSNQNSILGTFPCAGPNRALFRGGQVWYSSTGTLNVLSDSLVYNWTFEGGSPSSSSSSDPGYVTYNTPGHYVTRLQISGSSGGVDTTYRYVSVYDREDQGSSPPVVKWELTNLSGSRDEGGYKASFKVYENIPITENAVVVLFSDDWYGSNQVSLGGNYPNAEKIFWTGYVLEDTIRYNYQHSYIEFSAASVSELMKNSLGFSVSVESKASPAKWYELLDMDCRRAIYHYLKWHTTALSIADFQFVGDDRKIQFFDADRSSMYDAIDNLMRNTLIGKSVSDRQGKMWMEVEAKAYSNPTGSFTSVMEITKRDWMNQPSIDERFSDQLSFIEMGGIAYSGVVTGTFSAILAAAPGNAPSFRGRTDTHEGLALLGQAQLNQLVGNVWANENADYPKINLEMGINARNLDIAPQETTDIHILAGDTVRNLAIDGVYIPSEMNWKYEPKSQILLPSINFKVLVNGIEGEAVTIPISVPDAGFDTGFSVPGLQIPPLPILTIPPSLNQAIASYIAQNQGVSTLLDYAYASYDWPGIFGIWTTGNRGISIGTTSIHATLKTATITFTTAQAGLYAVMSDIQQEFTGGTPGGILSLTVNLTFGGLSVDMHGNWSGEYRTGGTAYAQKTYVSLFPLSAGNTISFSSTPLGISGTPSDPKVSLAAIRLTTT